MNTSEKLKSTALFWMRSCQLQPLWRKLHHLAIVGMNYHGAGSFSASGEKQLLRWIAKQVKEHSPIHILDVGANVGDYAQEAHRVFGGQARILCLEPSPVTFDLLKKRVAELPIECYQLGLSQSAGEASLFSSEKGSTIASLYQQENPLRPFSPEFTERVQLTTLDSFLAERNIESLDLLKLDIEGHEYPALMGASQTLRRRAIRYIQFEFGEAHMDAKHYFRDFYNLLSPAYRLFRLASNGPTPIDAYNPELEIFAPANFLAARI